MWYRSMLSVGWIASEAPYFLFWFVLRRRMYFKIGVVWPTLLFQSPKDSSIHVGIVPSRYSNVRPQQMKDLSGCGSDTHISDDKKGEMKIDTSQIWKGRKRWCTFVGNSIQFSWVLDNFWKIFIEPNPLCSYTYLNIQLKLKGELASR